MPSDSRVIDIWVSNNPKDPDEAHRISFPTDQYVSDVISKSAELFLFDGIVLRAGMLQIQLHGHILSNRTSIEDIKRYNPKTDVLIVSKKQNSTPIVTPTSASLVRRSSIQASPRMRISRRRSTASDMTDDESPMMLIKKGASLKQVPEWARNAEDIVIEAVRQNGDSLLFASEILRGEKRVVIEAVKNDGMSLRFASKELKDDDDVVMTAVSNYGGSLSYASNRLKQDEAIVNKAILTDPSCIRFAVGNSHIETDIKTVTEAVKQNGMSLQLLSSDYQNMPSVVQQAVMQNGNALQYATDTVKNNIQIVLSAVITTPSSVCYASSTLQNNPLVKLILSDSSYGDWPLKFHKFYTLHSIDTICTLPHILRRYKGKENLLWMTLLTKHGLTESDWCHPINTIRNNTIISSVICGLINILVGVLTERRPRSESVGSHQRMATSLSYLLPSPASDPLDLSGGSLSGEITNNTVEAKRILREVEQSSVTTAASMRRLLKSTIGGVPSQNTSQQIPIRVQSVDSDGITSSVTDENDKTIITHGGSITDPQDLVSGTDSCPKVIGLGNSLTLSDQSPASPSALMAENTELEGTTTIASTAIEEAMKQVRAHEKATQEMDTSLNDSPLTDIEIGMSTIDRKKKLHALTDGEVSSADDIKRMLLSMGAVPMRDVKGKQLSPRIDFCARPLTPREHAEETVERKKRRESKVLNDSIYAEIEEANAVQAKKQLSNLASSDVKSTTSIKKLLQSAGALAMTDNDMRELSPRLSGSYDNYGAPPPVPHHERRRSSVPSSKMERSIVIEDFPAGSFHIDVISCSTANHSDADSSPRSCHDLSMSRSQHRHSQEPSQPPDSPKLSSDEGSRPSGTTTPVIPQLDLFGIAATNANSKCIVIERELKKKKKEQRERKQYLGHSHSTNSSKERRILNEAREGKEYDDIETSSDEEDNHLSSRRLETTQPVSDCSELGATYSHAANSNNLLVLGAHNEERRKTEPQIITEPIKEIEKDAEKDLERGSSSNTNSCVNNNSGSNMIDGVRCEESTVSYESPTSESNLRVQSGHIESSPLDHSTSSVQASSAPSHAMNLPVIVEPILQKPIAGVTRCVFFFFFFWENL